MRQQLVRNLLFVLVINLVVKAVWIFFIDRNVQIRVGYADYGTYQALFNLGIIFQILLDFGMTQYNGREIARDPGRIRTVFSSMLWARLILVAVYMIIVSSIALAAGYSGWKLELLCGILLIQALNAMLLFLRSNVTALQYFKTDGVLAVTDRGLMIVVCGVLLLFPAWVGNFRIGWFVWAQAGCYLLAVAAAFAVLLKISPAAIGFSFRPRIIRAVVVRSMPYAVLVFLMSLYTRSDSVLIERLCGADGAVQAGIYASAFRLLDVANIFGIMFAGILLPLFARMLARKENIADLVRTSVNIMMPVAFIVAVGAAIFSEDVMQLLYHKARNGADSRVLALLLCSFPAYCLMYIYSTLLTANGSIRLLNKLSLLLVVFNLLLNVWTIPDYAATAAAYTALATEWLAASMVIYQAHRLFRLPHNYRWLAAHLGFVLMLVLAGMGMVFLPLSRLQQFIGYTAAAAVLLFVFRFWTIAAFRELMKAKATSA